MAFMPGHICRSRRAETTIPFCAGEVDQTRSDFRGDPHRPAGNADPEQNSTFRDNYLTFRLIVEVLFICTANMLDTIPNRA